LKNKFFIRLRSWEYWPIWVTYLPAYFYYIWLAVKARSFFFFSSTNPGIENGGMLGESKIKILDKIRAKPKTLFFSPDKAAEEIINDLERANITYPFIAKPDIGERGWGVKRIDDVSALNDYLNTFKTNFLVQEYVDLPVEAGVFYYRYPEAEKGRISSIVIKEMLTVTGDGKATLRELICNDNRALLQLDKLEKTMNGEMERILSSGQAMELVSIGNHCLGTTFLDGTHLADEQMTAVFDEIAHEISGFYFGRFDLRCASIAHLKRGEVMIMELNGAGAEPAHIYQPGFSFFSAQRVLLHHFSVMYEISRSNRKRGVKHMTFAAGLQEIKKLSRYNKEKAKHG